MEQHKIKITDIYGQDFGEKYITKISWDILRFPSLIEVDFACKNMAMYYQHDTDSYINEHGNLIGKIIK